MHRELTFDVMGTTAAIQSIGASERAMQHCRRFLDELHRRWTRFDATSELCRLNAASGRLCLVSPDTYDVVALAVDGWHVTEGRFDPTVLHAVEAAGYTTSWLTTSGRRQRTASTTAPGCRGIELHPSICAVELPPGTALDLGGVAKGHAADLAVALLMSSGAAGALVSIGGDVAVAGDSGDPADEGWTIELGPASRALGHPVEIRLRAGGVCTSSTERRRWLTDSGTAHHLIDPRTGRPTCGHWSTASVAASRAAGAEIAATAALTAHGDAVAWLDEHRLPAILTGPHRPVTTTASMTRLLTSDPTAMA